MSFRVINAAAAAALFVSAIPASAQSAFTRDAESGILLPLPKAASTAAAARAIASRAGRYEIDVAVTYKFPYPAGAKPTCGASLSHFGGTGVAYQEMGSYVAATGAGAAWQCKVVVPYLWAQADTASPVIVTLTVTSGNAATSRSHSRVQPPTPLPANNAVTKLTYAVTL